MYFMYICFVFEKQISCVKVKVDRKCLWNLYGIATNSSLLNVYFFFGGGVRFQWACYILCMFRYLFINTITSLRTNGPLIIEIPRCVTQNQDSERYDDMFVWNHWSIHCLIFGFIKRIKMGIQRRHVWV